MSEDESEPRRKSIKSALYKFVSAKQMGAPKILQSEDSERTVAEQRAVEGSHLKKLRNMSSIHTGANSFKENRRLEKYSYLYHSWKFNKLIRVDFRYTSEGNIPYWILSPDLAFFTYVLNEYKIFKHIINT